MARTNSNSREDFSQYHGGAGMPVKAMGTWPGSAGTHMKKTLKAAKKRRPVGMQMRHDRDPAEVLFDKIGSLKGVEVLNQYVLFAIYERPTVTKGGIHLTDNAAEEDQYQGKAGLILKLGPLANLSAQERGVELKVGMWIAVKPSDGWTIKLNGVHCRLINEKAIQMVIPTPDAIW